MNSTFSINWNGHKNNICYGFSSFQQNEEFVDMTLAAEGQSIKVHQNVMAVASPYLKDLLKSIPCPHPVIFFNNISHSTLRLILEYVYNGEVQIPLHKVQSFIDAAKSLQMIGIGAARGTDVGLKNYFENENVDLLKPKKNIQNPDMCTNLLKTFLESDLSNDKTNAIQLHNEENDSPRTISGLYTNVSNQNTDPPLFQIMIPAQSIEPEQFEIMKSNENAKQLPSMISLENDDNVCIEETDLINLSTNKIIDDCSLLEDFEQMPVNVVHVVNKQKLNEDELNAESMSVTEDSTDVNDDTSILQTEPVPCDSDVSKDTNNTTAGPSKLNIRNIKIIKPASPKRPRRCSKKGMEWLISLNKKKKENKEIDDEKAEQLCPRNWEKISGSSEKSDNEDAAESDILKDSDVPKYSISNRGCLQLNVGRYLYYAHHVSGYGLKRRWRCIEYRKLRCPAYLDAFKDVISTRKNDHSHGFHDMKILKKKNDHKLFDNLEDALNSAAQVCEEMNVDLTTDDE